MHIFLHRLCTQKYIPIALLMLFEVFLEMLCIQWLVKKKKNICASIDILKEYLETLLPFSLRPFPR